MARCSLKLHWNKKITNHNLQLTKHGCEFEFYVLDILLLQLSLQKKTVNVKRKWFFYKVENSLST